jgi:hypothetical protein
VGQVPDAVPAMPPPSNIVLAVVDVEVELDVEVTAGATPVPNDVEVVPVDEPPMPAVTELPGPYEDSAIEFPMPRHAAMLLVVGASGDTPEIVGLTPGDCICVAPRGTRTGATGAAEPMPSGDVMLSGVGSDETCAKAGPQPNSTAAVAAITKRVITFTLVFFGTRFLGTRLAPPGTATRELK